MLPLQIYFATGRPEQALSAAESVAESNPEDVNAHALHLLCMEALGKIDESPAEALAACTKMLQCDGSSHRYDWSHKAPRLVRWQGSFFCKVALR